MRQDTIKLSNGIIARLEMPSLYAVLASIGDVPSPEMSRVLQLLEGTDALPAQNLLQKKMGQRDYWMAHYEIAKLCMVEPKLVLGGVEPGPGEISDRDLSLNEVQAIYRQFLLGEYPIITSWSVTQNAEGAQAPVPAGDDLPETAK